MAGFMDGKKKQSGGNVQREKFGGSSNKAVPEKHEVKGAVGVGDSPMDDGDEPTTTITHHADGTHSVMHADGDMSDHPSIEDAMAGIHAKHGGDLTQMLGEDGGNGSMEMSDGMEPPRHHGAGPTLY